jgi:hypothetical protein
MSKYRHRRDFAVEVLKILKTKNLFTRKIVVTLPTARDMVRQGETVTRAPSSGSGKHFSLHRGWPKGGVHDYTGA